MATKHPVNAPARRPVPVSVLAIDIVSYSQRFDETQVRSVKALNKLIRLALKTVAPTSSPVVLPTGDGAILVFPERSSDVALDLAIELHRTIRVKLLELPIRMGIHEGAGIRLKDVNRRTNIAGNVVNTCQRVMDVGDTGHVLLSESAYSAINNQQKYISHLNALKANPILVKHGVSLNIYSYYDGEYGKAEEPSKVQTGMGIILSSIGRTVPWETLFDTENKLKIIGNSIPLFGTPQVLDKLEALICHGTHVRVLVLNPLSSASDLRAESRAYDSLTELQNTLKHIIEILIGFQKRIEFRGTEAVKRFEVGLFDAIPTFTGFITDTRAHVSFYVEHLSGSRGPFISAICRPSGPCLYDCIETAFDTIWSKRALRLFDKNLVQGLKGCIARRTDASLKLRIPEYLK